MTFAPLSSSSLRPLLPVVALILFAGSVPHTQAVDLTFRDCPKAVQETISANRKGGRIEDIDYDPTRRIYEVEIQLAGRRDLDLYIASSGRLIRSFEDLPLAKVPRAVRSTIRRLMGDRGRLDDLERVRAGTSVTYRLEIDFPTGADLHATLSKKGLVLKRNRRD